ncbi:MAG: phosphoribosylformylglycinamidine synthase I [Planctomycetes bacterium]|nr:phosphoribosylformylglycinamidine synthase I [Planctomycetota bacterium]
MANIRAIVLRAAGINCDLETEHALEVAGAAADRVHINRIIETPLMLDEYQIMVFPGGFSYGDDVAAGRILANQIVHHLSDVLRKFIDDGKLALGICNGFQVLVKMGILPDVAGDGKLDSSSVSIVDNDCGQFQDRWVYLQPGTDRCVFITPGKRIYLPMAHGEGKVVMKDTDTLEKIKDNGHVAFRYVDADGNTGGFPVNPNGSTDHIAGLVDSTGRVMGLMPHPERFIQRTQHPRWTRHDETLEADGVSIFKNAVGYLQG